MEIDKIDKIASDLAEVDRATPPTTVTACGVGGILDGKTQPWKLQAEDGYWYVVKAQNNPQDTRARNIAPCGPLKILTTDLICGRLGQLLSPPLCPPAVIIDVPQEIATQCVRPKTGEQFAPGPSFGSQFIPDVADCKEEGDVERISPEMAARLVVFQTWLFGDDLSALVSPEGDVVLSVDHGFYLTGLAWSCPVSPVLKSNSASEKSCLLSQEWRNGFRNRFWQDDRHFRDVLDELDSIPEEVIVRQFAGVPTEWGATPRFLGELATFVLTRRTTVRKAMQSFSRS